MTAEAAWQSYKKSDARFKGEHTPDCSYKGKFIPMNVCPCDCYEKYIFTMGYRLAKGLSINKTDKKYSHPKKGD